jgi:hypothetical protein
MRHTTSSLRLELFTSVQGNTVNCTDRAASKQARPPVVTSWDLREWARTALLFVDLNSVVEITL